MSDEQEQGDALTEEFEKSFNTEEEKAAEIPSPEEDEQQEEEEEGFSLEVVKLQQELKAEQDKYFRLLAELENTRKRMHREKEDGMRFAIERAITEFLGPLDHFEKALEFASQGSNELKQWAQGFQMILMQFKEVLTSHHVTSFSALGKMFDPHCHEALETEDSDEEGRVLAEFAKGYKCGDRILRPAKVKVSKKMENPHDQEEKH